MPENKCSPAPRDVEGVLNEIDRILHQMLVLAELSASDGNIDRAALQRTLVHLRRKIDSLASTLETL